jgi:hypothetical protein
MSFPVRWKYGLVALLILFAIWIQSFVLFPDSVDFNADIKPLINKKCITCHGGVRKKGDYSLLFRHEALSAGASGRPGIIPGDPAGSELIRRLTLKDEEERMPYHGEPLNKEEIDLLKRWVRQGAKWDRHWAYQPVKPVETPDIGGGWFTAKKAGIVNEIDLFVRERLNEMDLKPSQQADKRTLLRRVSLDLTGLPAPEGIAAAFLKDESPQAYERLVDTLLGLPTYGERWTSTWLDLARYADSKGYESDGQRIIWRYRDWVIKAFNADMPYDRFLTEQIAGDLVPGATDEQYIATAFHRNSMTNNEGGTDNEEFRTAAVIDRVNTTWEVLMGTTFACVQCHTHPYDPFLHEEYYRFMAFFNNTRDEDTDGDYPLLHEYRGSDSLRHHRLKTWLQANVSADEGTRIVEFLRTRQPSVNSLTADRFVNSELADTKWLALRQGGSARLKGIDLSGKDFLLTRMATWRKDGVLRITIDSLKGAEILRKRLSPTQWWSHIELPIRKVQGVHDIYVSYQSPTLKDPNENGVMFDWLHFTEPFPGAVSIGRDTAMAWFRQLLDAKEFVTTPVMMDNPAWMARKTFVFEKGSWLAPGREVSAGVPSSLNPFPSDAPSNRLGLARWMTDRQNPLTARTMVNRLWEQLFGQGLVETVEDLGTQGIPPTHRELLDHLSWKFMHEMDWSVKSLLRYIVLSATYRQSSVVEAGTLEKDPYNRWLSRGPRIRLSAEQIRDQALAVSGLLSGKLYGPSVMPYQPDGIWQSPYNDEAWVTSKGEDRHRRALYTYLKRTGTYPSFMSFDGSSREVCQSRRIRTNTPLQALTTLNDTVFLEAARHLAFRHVQRKNTDPVLVIRTMFEKASGRPIDERSRASLEYLYRVALERFRKDRDDTCEMVGLQDANNNPETAALVVVANAILNLDEVLTKS